MIAASAISFGAGIALGAAFSGCCGPGWGWGWGCNWGPRGAVIVNNNFLRALRLRPALRTASPKHRGKDAFPGSSPPGTVLARVCSKPVRSGSRYPLSQRQGGSGRFHPYGSAARVQRTPNGAAGAVAGRHGAAAGVRTPNAAAGGISPRLAETPPALKRPPAQQSRHPTTPFLIFRRLHAPAKVRTARTAWRAVVTNLAAGVHPHLQARAALLAGPVPGAATRRERPVIAASAAWAVEEAAFTGEPDPIEAEDGGAEHGLSH